jgi:transcriptional regulator with XRE-family HTH domain
MTASRETIEYKCGQAAVSSLFRRILKRSGLTQKELEIRLRIERAEGSNYGKYLRGEQVPSWGRFLQFVRAARRERWLTLNELQELGMKDAAVAAALPDDIQSARKKALDLFLDGRDRILIGLLPMYVHGSRGERTHRPPIDDAEMARGYARWIAEIELLGGKVTHKTYKLEPAQTDLDVEQREAEQANKAWKAWQASLSGFQREFELAHMDYLVEQQLLSEANAEEGYSDAPTPPTPQLPAHHVENVRELNLWFGGRDYSAYPYRLVHEDEVTVYWRGDPTRGLQGLESFNIRRAARKRRAKAAETQAAMKAKRAINRAASCRGGAKVAHQLATAGNT